MSSAEASATIHLGRSRVPWSRDRQVLSRIMRKFIRRLKRMVKCVQKGKPTEESRWAYRCWRYLFSRPVARQLSSAVMSLTSVFGMGTGGPSCQSTPTMNLEKTKTCEIAGLCVGTIYFPGQSPGKYRRRIRA